MDDAALIQQTLSLYSLFGSRGDWDRVLTTYVPDGVWDIPHLGVRFEGHDAIREALTQFFGLMGYVLQLNAPAVVEVDGESATAQSLIHEFGKVVGREEGFEFLGWYEDTLIRTPDGWKFVERIFRHLGTHSFPLAARNPFVPSGD